ncbi:MAG: DeoR/GlpR family DNA-binding transcription regulator [Ruminiclostridium sp.]
MASKSDDRKAIIINELESNTEVDIAELSQRLGVTEMTIRRDLKKLESDGILIRTYKGAISAKKTFVDDSIMSRISENEEGKEIICRYATGLIKDEDIIMIDASTTALRLCKYIKDKKITVVTNSINVASALADAKEVNVVVVGGILRKSSVSLVGETTVESLKKLNIGKSFISAKALSFEDGLTDVNIFEIETKKAAISKSKEVIVLLDNHKLNKVSLQRVCDRDSIDKIVIDGLREFTEEEEIILQSFRDYGVEVMIIK